MRDLNILNAHRTNRPNFSGDEGCGMFQFPSPVDGQELRVLASSDGGWDHVSVSLATRCPTWPEMAYVKHLFFKDDETAIQFHVPTKDHINIHPFCLHLWRSHDQEIQLPPPIMV